MASLKAKFIFFGGVVCIVLVFVLIFIYSPGKKRLATAQVRGETLTLEVVSEPADLALGLMYRESLGKNSGMLFIFSSEGAYSFWMKNTKIPLDIIWLDSGYKVVYIKENALPCTTENCEAYTPESKAKYVVEVNGGWVTQTSVSVGDRFEIIV